VENKNAETEKSNYPIPGFASTLNFSLAGCDFADAHIHKRRHGNSV
jgi:hypothetical protein